MIETDFYTAPQAAKICRVSHATIVRAIQDGALKSATTPGGHYRILRDELEVFMRKNGIPLKELAPRAVRVLVVEDNPAELRLMRRVLEADLAFEVKTASTGYEAGYLTKSWRPDVLLLDIFLKDMDGRQVAGLIRSDPELKGIKIIAVSVLKDPEEIKGLLARGMDAFLPKPVEKSKLLQAIHSVA